MSSTRVGQRSADFGGCLPRWGERERIEVEAGYVVAYGERRAEKFEEEGDELSKCLSERKAEIGFLASF